MKKAIIIITTNDKKDNRFIKLQSEQQEWVDGWCFSQENEYMYRLGNMNPIPFSLKKLNEKEMVILLNKSSNFIIWINQYKWKAPKNAKDIDNLCNPIIILIRKLISSKYSIKIAYHNLHGDILAKLKKIKKQIEFKSYTLSPEKRERFKKITKEQNGNDILDSKASFKNIEEVFFQPLVYVKKKLISLWLPLAIDIQGLSEVREDEKKKQNYFNDIKKFYKNHPIENEKVEKIKICIKDDGIKNLIDERKTKCEEILQNIKSDQNNLDEFYKEYVNKENQSFFPSLLQNLVKKIDQKIK